MGLTAYLFSFKRAFIFHTLFALFLLILALGKNFFIDINYVFFNYFPIWKVSRSPEKLIIPFAFFLVFAQAIGWQWVLDRLKDKRETVLLIGSWLILCSLSFFLVQRLAPVEGYAISKDSWRLFFLVNLLQGIVLVAARCSLNLRHYRWYLLLLVFAVDSGIHARSMIWDQPVKLFDSLFANKIKSDLLERSSEIRSGAAFRYSLQMTKPDLVAVPRKLDAVSIRTVVTTKILFPGVPGLYGIHDICGHGALQNAQKVSLWEELTRMDSPKYLNILSVYYIGTNSKIDNRMKFKIVKNKAAVPYVFIPRKIRHIVDSTNIVNRLVSKDFNEQEEALVESGKSLSIENSRVESIEILRKESSSIQIKVEREKLEETAYLILNESLDRHWRAYINDESAPIYRANGWSMAINLKRSCGADCLVEFRYENIWIKRGSFISLSFVLISLSLFVFRKFSHSGLQNSK